MKKIFLIFVFLKDYNLYCNVVNKDLLNISTWHKGEKFNKILLDAPCSAIGVIRKNPEIKLFRDEKQITQSVNLQEKLLNAVWPMLKDGGKLLYTTCSILPEENTLQIERFISNNANAHALHIELNSDLKNYNTGKFGHQIIPGQKEMDGFYYCLLEKTQA